MVENDGIVVRHSISLHYMPNKNGDAVNVYKSRSFEIKHTGLYKPRSFEFKHIGL